MSCNLFCYRHELSTQKSFDDSTTSEDENGNKNEAQTKEDEVIEVVANDTVGVIGTQTSFQSQISTSLGNN